MSNFNYKYTKLGLEQARKLITHLASKGRLLITQHAQARLLERNIIINDVINVLLSCSMRVSEPDLQPGGYAYRCSTNKFTVVVGFTIQGDGLVLITVFKVDKKG